MCDCTALQERIDELEAENAFLRGETSGDALARLNDHVRSALPLRSYHSRGAAKLLLHLYNRRGATMRPEALLAVLPPLDPARDPMDRVDNIIRVWVSVARKAMGPEVIETIWGGGYRISAVGMERIEGIVGNQARPVAAKHTGR